MTSPIMYEWNPLEVVKSALIAGQVPRDKYGCELQYTIILLNQKVLNEDLFLALWNEAAFRMLVDGGGNHWRLLSRKFPDLVQFPHVVCGNFDSIRPDILDLFRIGHTPDDDTPVDIVQFPPKENDQHHHAEKEIQEGQSTQIGMDFIQALDVLSTNDLKEKHPQLESVPIILAYSETSGHFNQIMANISTLHSYALGKHPAQLFLISSSSITFLLMEGNHRIFCGRKGSRCAFLKISDCSLLPIGTPCIVTTQGLRHDLCEETLAFGKKIITNEQIVGMESHETDDNETKTKRDENFIVQVSTSAPILYDMEFIFDNQLQNVW